MDRLTSMAVFVRAADLGSLTAAAATLGLSPQMVGRHVRSLEERLGARLLNRSTRRQSLTEVGRAYRERCRAILAEAEAADALAHDLGTAPRGRLRVNAPVVFGAHGLAPLIAGHLVRNPGLEIELSLSDRFVDLVEEGYDAVVRLGPLKDSGLAARRLAPYRLVACAAPEYLAARGTPLRPEDLAGHDCLGFVFAAGEAAEWRFAGPDGERAVPVRGRFHVNDGRVLRDMALAGLGVVLATEVLVGGDIAAGRLVRVLPDHAPPAREMHLLFPARRPRTLKLQGFIDLVVGAFGRDGGLMEDRRAAAATFAGAGRRC